MNRRESTSKSNITRRVDIRLVPFDLDLFEIPFVDLHKAMLVRLSYIWGVQKSRSRATKIGHSLNWIQGFST